jgi:hypothetical protein
MTTFDPDTLVQDVDVLRRIVERFDGTLALNANVVRGGVVREGDPVEIAPSAGLGARRPCDTIGRP